MKACTNFYLNFVKLDQILIVITLFQLIWYQTEFRLDCNQSETSDYYQNVVRFDKIHNRSRVVQNDPKFQKCIQVKFLIT